MVSAAEVGGAGAARPGAGGEWDIDKCKIFTTDSVSIERLG